MVFSTARQTPSFHMSEAKRMQCVKLTCALALCAMQVKLLRQADRTLELLEVDEAKYADELSLQQKEFASSVNTLAAVRCQQPSEDAFGGICKQSLG
jgi:hypothetical protein